MQINVFKNYEELCNEVANFIVNEIKELPSPLLCLAGGDTPLGVYKNFVELSKSGRASFNKAQFIGLDEWVGLNGADSGSCRFTLDESMYRPLAIEKSKIHFFDGKATGLSRQCNGTNQLLETNGPIDLALLGIGMPIPNKAKSIGPLVSKSWFVPLHCRERPVAFPSKKWILDFSIAKGRYILSSKVKRQLPESAPFSPTHSSKPIN